MPITLSDFLTFPFNGGKGIRTNQLDGKIGVDQVVDALRDGSIILADTDGSLPDPADNQGRFALTDSGISVSRNHPTDAVVTFKLFGPDRVVASGEPAISSKEMQYAGSFPNTEELPAIADYSVGAYLWSVSAQNWFHKDSTLQTAWRQSNHPGAPLVYNNFIYGTLEEAANHVHGVGNWQPNGNSVAIIGHGNSQVAYVLTAYTAPSNDNWQWDHLGISQADILAIVDQHNTATDAHDDIRTAIGTDISTHNTSGTAHNDIRSDVSTVEDRLDALDGVEIEAYSTTATYSRGSANSIVTHSSGLFIYISATERSSGHDPDTQPGYWFELSEGVAYEVISSGSHRIAARTLVVNGDNDNVYLCTTTQTTPRDLDYIHAQSESVGGAFILLNGSVAVAGPILRCRKRHRGRFDGRHVAELHGHGGHRHGIEWRCHGGHPWRSGWQLGRWVRDHRKVGRRLCYDTQARRDAVTRAKIANDAVDRSLRSPTPRFTAGRSSTARLRQARSVTI